MSAVFSPSSGRSSANDAPKGQPMPSEGAKAFPQAAEKAVKAAEKELPPMDRLALSRSHMRAAMSAIAHPPPRAPLFGKTGGDLKQKLIDRFRAIPGAAILAEGLASWWKEHPLRTVGVVAGQASRTVVRPLANRNPQSLLIGAAAIGALFVLTRPWRWLLRPALFVGLVPQLVSHALKRMPAEAWMSVFTAALGGKPGTSPAAKKKSNSREAPAKTSTP